MTGRKFGSSGDEPMTWAMNSHLPAARLPEIPRKSRLVAFSSGNIYGLTPVEGGGSRETDELRPVGEYAMSCLGRERMLEYFQPVAGHSDAPIVRPQLSMPASCATASLSTWPSRSGQGKRIDLRHGLLYASSGRATPSRRAMALRALAHVATPAWIVNVAGAERLSVREVSPRRLAG